VTRSPWVPRPSDLLAHAVHRTGRVKSLALAQMVNILFQALLLAVSLLSIAFHRNLIPARIAVVIPVAGVWALAVTGHTQPFASDEVHKDIRQVSAGLRSTRRADSCGASYGWPGWSATNSPSASAQRASPLRIEPDRVRLRPSSDSTCASIRSRVSIGVTLR
jgi:hypothetical protein